MTAPDLAVTEPAPSSRAMPALVTSIGPRGPGRCPVCAAPLPAPTKGPAKRYCSDACRQRAHRGQSAETCNKVAPAKALTRDETVSRLCHALKTHEGLRDGLDALCRIVEDERARLQAMPLYSRRQIARRFLDGLGLKLAETDQ